MAYVAKTAAEIQSQAASEYQSYYDQLTQSAQQSYGTNDLLLQQQIAGLGATYAKQAETSDKNYALAYSQSGREQLARGMGRSSYALQTLANVNKEGIEAKQAIFDAQATTQANLEAQRTQLSSQLAERIAQYSASQASDILKRIAELQDTEYQKQYQAERDAAKDSQWQAEYNEMIRQFDASLAARSSSGGSSGSKKTTVVAPQSGLTLDQMLNMLNLGSGSPGSTNKATSSHAGVSLAKKTTNIPASTAALGRL